MSSSKFSDAFEREAVAQITEGPCGEPPRHHSPKKVRNTQQPAWS